MKKQIMSKRGRRFDDGGEVQNIPRARTAEDDQEAADKAAGLAASNKEKPMGFFERLRAGNIDDPNSEAYKRFGAGRGRADRVPVADVMPTPVERAKPVSTPVSAPDDEMEAANKREPISVEAGPRAEPSSKPNKIVSAQSAAKPVILPPKLKDTSNYSNEGIGKTTPSAKTETETKSKPKKDMYRTFGGKMAEKTPDKSPAAGLGDLIGRGAKAAGEAFDKYEFMTPAKRIAKENEEKKKARGSFSAFKSGGSVSKASSRGDGIAQRGKTRGKMC
jgi:hypothetical protein